MDYEVRITAPAEDDAYAAFEAIRDVAPEAAERWLVELFQAIFSLKALPRRCPLIPEAQGIGCEVRHLLYGKRTATVRIIFDIDDEAACVRVLRIWHGARDCIRQEDLEPA